MRRALLVVAAALASPVALPPDAEAHALMSASGGVLRLSDGDTISRNTVTVTAAGAGRARFSDPTADGGMGPGSALDRCVPLSETELECDLRGISVIRIDVGSDDDKVTYSHSLAVRIFGGGGRDELTGGAGRDVVDGGDGADRVEGGGGDDAVGGGAGDDSVSGGAGDDLLQGGAGVDTVEGGDGDDELRVRDGSADRVACGAGTDRAVVDRSDPAGPAQGCEAVERAAPAADGSDLLLPGAGDAGGPENFAVRAVAAERQSLRRGRLAVAATSTRAATLSAAGSVTVAGRRVRLAPATARVTVAGGGAELRLWLPRTALRKGVRRVTARIAVTARQQGGATARSRMVRVVLSR